MNLLLVRTVSRTLPLPRYSRCALCECSKYTTTETQSTRQCEWTDDTSIETHAVCVYERARGHYTGGTRDTWRHSHAKVRGKYPVQYTHMSHRRSHIHGPHKTTSMGHIHGPHKTTLTDPGLAGLSSLSPLSPLCLVASCTLSAAWRRGMLPLYSGFLHCRLGARLALAIQDAAAIKTPFSKGRASGPL